MKRNIVFFYDWALNPDLQNCAAGGSETWIIEITNYLQSLDYCQCIIVQPNECSFYYMQQNGVLYINKECFKNFVKHTKIDECCFVRWIDSNMIDLLSQYYNKLDTYFVVHDIGFFKDGEMLKYSDIQNNEFLKNNFKKIICMSEYAIMENHYCTEIPLEYYEYLGNGINTTYIDKSKIDNGNKDDDLIWTSRVERGLHILANNIFPLYKKEFPNAKLYVATYMNELPEDLQNNEDIIFLGGLGKEDLYNEMLKHKIFFYPNTFPETFCISILEAILCGNELVMPYRHGPQTTLKIFKDLLQDESLDYDNCTTEDYELAANLLVKHNKFYYNNTNKKKRQIMRNYINKEYSWEAICNKFINILNKKGEA